MTMLYRLIASVKNISGGWMWTSFLYESSAVYVNPLTPRTPRLLPAVYLFSQKSAEPKSKIKIDLVGLDEKISVVFLQEAEKLAKRRDLKLVKVADVDNKTQRPMYKLVSGIQYFEIKQVKHKPEARKTLIKGQKLLPLSEKIADHDLESKIKMVKKWLTKNFEVAVIINGSDFAMIDHIVQVIESSLKEMGAISQKEKKSHQLKFKVLPLRNEHVDTNEDENHST